MSGATPTRRCLPVSDWPEYDQRAWSRALHEATFFRTQFRPRTGLQRAPSASIRFQVRPFTPTDDTPAMQATSS